MGGGRWVVVGGGGGEGVGHVGGKSGGEEVLGLCVFVCVFEYAYERWVLLDLLLYCDL